MRDDQRARALRLADVLKATMGEAGKTGYATQHEVADFLRELAAEPVQQPVAWMDDGSTGGYGQPTIRVVTAATKAVMHASTAKAYTIPLYAAPVAQPARVPMTWQPIETAPQNRIVLVHYTNDLGNGRTMRARYYPPETLESDVAENGWADEGWYEESEAYEYLMPLEHDPPPLTEERVREIVRDEMKRGAA